MSEDGSLTRGMEKDRSQTSEIVDLQNISSSNHGQELKVVLLGHDDAARGSAGNLILGCRAFDTEGRAAQCVKREAEILGRKVTVVSAPGWSKLACVDNTPGLTKQEIILSTSHCSPGPHVVLLVTNLEDNRADQQHVELLGEGVWAHTIVLGTSKKHVSMETQHSTLLEKCDNRLFILENDTSKDREQVKNLIKKMDKLVLQNEGRHYEVERGIIQQLSTKRELEAEEAEERKMAIIRQRKTLEFVLGAVSKPSELNIVLVGNRGSGKTSAVHTILQTQQGRVLPTTQCSKHVGSVGDRKVTVVDTPGWGRGALVEYNAPDMISSHLDSSSPTAYILVIQLDVSFLRHDRESAQTFFNKLGDGVWKKAIVLFTHGDWLGDTPVEQYIQSEGSALIWVIEKCQNRFHVLSNQNTSNTTQVTELIEKIDEMAAMAAMTVNETESEGFSVEAETKSQEEPEIKVSIAGGEMSEVPGAFGGIWEDVVDDDIWAALERIASKSMDSPPSMASCDRSGLLSRTCSMESFGRPQSFRGSHSSIDSLHIF